MGAVWARFRAEARAHFGSWIALALLIAFVGAALMAITAGARRTDTAHPRFLATHAASDLVIGDGAAFGFGRPANFDTIAALPQVRAAAVARYHLSGGRTGSGRTILPGFVGTLTSPDGALGRRVDRWKLLEGRRARPDRMHEAVASFEFVRQLDLSVGDTVHLRFVRENVFPKLAIEYLAALRDRTSGRTPPPTTDILETAGGPAISVKLVGIEAAPFEFPPQAGNIPARLYLSRAFHDAHGSRLAGSNLLSVRLRQGVDPAAFRAEVERLNPETQVEFFGVGTENAANVQRSIHLQAVALAILAGLIGLAGAVAIAQALSRQAFVGSDDSVALLAVGMTRRQLLVIGGLRAGSAGLLGAVVAVAAAVALSPVWPIGLARTAEPDPGLATDWLVLGVGAVVVVAFATAVGAIATSRWTMRSARSPITAPAVFGPLPVRLGIRHALEPGRGRTAVPVRSAILATGVAVATAVVAVTFSTSLDHLLATPRLYGWTADAQIGSLGLPPFADPVVAGLRDNPAVAAVSAGTVSELDVEGTRVTAFALDDVVGTFPSDLLEGRRPRHNDEIVLGTRTLEDADARIGDRVRVGIGGATVPMRVVGRAVFPEIGDNGQLGRGAQTTFAALRRQFPDAAANIVQVRLADGLDKQSARSDLRAAVSPIPVIGPEPPTDLATFGRVDELPIITAVIMVTVAIAVLAHALVISVRRRRRDFAVLETLGCERRQIAAIVAAQATTLALLALLVGIPVGLLVSRISWRWVTDELGVTAESTSILGALAVLVPVIVLLANVVAAGPEWLARRTRPAAELRAE